MTNRVSSAILNFLFKGKISTFFITFVILALCEIFFILGSNIHGESNTSSWAAVLLGIFVAFPWLEIMAGSHKPDEFMHFILIPAVIFNTWIIYKTPYWFGSNSKKFPQKNYSLRALEADSEKNNTIE